MSIALATRSEFSDIRWWLVHTRPRSEKALASDLDRLGISYCLPLARTRRRIGGRTTESVVPLFPGYLFLRGGNEERCATMHTKRAANVIKVVDQQGLEADLSQVARVTESEEPVDLYPGIRRGRQCVVVRGPLKGLEGVVVRRRDVCRVYVAVDVLGQSAEVEIDVSMLELIDEA